MIQEKKIRVSTSLWFDAKEIEKENEKMVYMDNAATTYPKPECVYHAMNEANRCLSVNTGRGSYRLAQIAVEGMDVLRTELLKFIYADNQAEVVFTPSATIACNQIIGGRMLSKQDRVYVSPFEHNAVMRTLWKKQQECGCVIEEIPIDEKTLEIDLEKMKYLFLQKPPTYVFLSHVSNVTGYILPIEDIFKIAKEVTGGESGVILDAAQSFGLVEIDYRKTPFDAIVFAGHKNLYGPFGAAGFIKKNSFHLNSYLTGGTGSASLELTMPKEIPQGLEPGSPNIIAIAGLYAGLQFIKEEKRERIFEHEKKLSDVIVERIHNIKGVKLYVPEHLEKHIGVISFSIDGYKADEVGMILDEDYHIAVRTGYHCTPLLHKHLKDESCGGTVRASVGRFNNEKDVEYFINAIKEIVEG